MAADGIGNQCYDSMPLSAGASKEDPGSLISLEAWRLVAQLSVSDGSGKHRLRAQELLTCSKVSHSWPLQDSSKIGTSGHTKS